MASRSRRAEPASESTVMGLRAPDSERLISDVETLKALSDPLRLRIIELMVRRPEGAWSVKEMAAALDVPATRLYHHVELLLERDLVRAAEQRVVSGIIETRYQVSALSFRLDQGLVRGAGPGQTAARDVITTIFDETRRDLERVLASQPADDDGMLDRTSLARSLVRLTPAQAAELRARLRSIVDEYDTASDGPDATTYHLLVVMYGEPSEEEASHG
jgi:DNA-binding transcriptional ArsR family regulator